MRIKKYIFIYEYDNEADELSKLIKNQPDAIEYEEEGYIDLDSVVGVSNNFELLQVYLKGGHTVTLDEDLNTFLSDWVSD
jgi:hypothetical protein